MTQIFRGFIPLHVTIVWEIPPHKIPKPFYIVRAFNLFFCWMLDHLPHSDDLIYASSQYNYVAFIDVSHWILIAANESHAEIYAFFRVIPVPGARTDLPIINHLSLSPLSFGSTALEVFPKYSS